MPDAGTPLPRQKELLLPFLETLDELGGTAPSSEVRHALASRMGLSEDQRTRTVPSTRAGTRHVSAWGRTVRWVQQQAKIAKLTAAPTDGVWSLEGPGTRLLRNARPGVVITVFESEQGTMLWADARDAIGVVENDLVDLILTSPPYPLLRTKKYQNQHPVHEHLDFVTDVIEAWLPKLARTGSLVLNVGDVYLRGMPAQSGWTERLLVRLLDRGLYKCPSLYWFNPSRLPSPAEWVTIRRLRIKDAVEPCWHLVKDPHLAKADNRRVLRDYSPRMRDTLARGGEHACDRPSGHQLQAGSFGADNGGAIPDNLLSLPNTDSNSHYLRRCREENVPVHPARFPGALADFAIRYLTEPGDLVSDPFGGSGQVAYQAERLQRRWISSDLSLTYLHGAAFRFEHVHSFRSHFPSDIDRTLHKPHPDLFPSTS